VNFKFLDFSTNLAGFKPIYDSPYGAQILQASLQSASPDFYARAADIVRATQSFRG
jgi:hypothetical protein